MLNIGDSNIRPYVEFNITPEDPRTGKQYQKSSVLDRVTNPALVPWNKEEKFQFIVPDKQNTKVHVAL